MPILLEPRLHVVSPCPDTGKRPVPELLFISQTQRGQEEMNPYTDILFLSLVVIYIVDVSGFTESWLAAFSKWLGHTVTSVKPFSCSLCMTWWAGIIYLIVTGRFCIPLIAYVALFSYLSFPISQILIFIKEFLLKWISW